MHFLIAPLLAIALVLAPVSALAWDPILDEIIEKVGTAYNKRERPMVIFDIEGTLMDNRPRILRIVHDYAKVELKKTRPDAAQRLLTLKVDDIHYRLADTLRAAGIEEDAVITNGQIFWAERFFTNEYLKHDVPAEGAVEFVRSLYSKGARIVYLTGRDTQRQLVGTVETLQTHGFPIGIQGTELIMRPTAQTPSAIFKQQVNNYLRVYGKVIAAFDNEPKNINVHRRAFGESICVLFHALHSPNPPPLLANIHHVGSFSKSVAPLAAEKPIPASEAATTAPPKAVAEPVRRPVKVDENADPLELDDDDTTGADDSDPLTR